MKLMLSTATQVQNSYLMRSLRVSRPRDFVSRRWPMYGIDSLAAMEFLNLLRIELGSKPTTLEVVNVPSLLSACENIIGQALYLI